MQDVPPGYYSVGINLTPSRKREIAAFDGETGEPLSEDVVTLEPPVLVLPANVRDFPVSDAGRFVA